MPVVSTQSIQGLGRFIATAGPPSGGPLERSMEVAVIHELDSSGAALPETQYRVIPPSPYPTLVTFRSEVAPRPTSQTMSDVYMATVRRRKARRLAEGVAELAKYSDRDDFTVWTYPIVQQIKDLIWTLTDSEKEGNTREVLRQLRDTFMNQGWETYRRSDARTLAGELLENLASAEEITPKQANAAFDRLLELGLNPVGHFICGTETDEEESNGGEEPEISG